MRRQPSIHVLVAAGAMLALAGCILFVNDDPSKLTTTCHFQGDSTVCGLCVSSACSKSLGACCGDATCARDSLPLLGACFSGTTPCDTVLTPSLATCIASACPACAGGGPPMNVDEGGTAPVDAAQPPGTTSCSSVGDSCFCSVGGAPNSAVCNTAGIKGGGLCCASYGWPQATGTSCSCEPFSCTPTSSGATCSTSTNSTGTTTWGGTGCCAYGTFCDCAASQTCSATPVTQCDVSAVGCGSSQVQVTSCSF